MYSKLPIVNESRFHVGKAGDLKGRDRHIYRFFEFIPGILAWGTILATILLSKYLPVWAAFFIIAFDSYWLFKTVYLSIHHYHNWKRMKKAVKEDWQARLKNLKYEHIFHMVLLPFVKEGDEVLETSLNSLADSDYDLSKLIIVLAVEEKGGLEAVERAERMQKKYSEIFGHILVSVHPTGLEGEIAGKGPNISYASEKARIEILDKNKIPYEDVIVSAFDVDTASGPGYFACLTWYFLTTPNPFRSSFQPVPVYNNNIWQAPAVSRVAAMSSTFWQMIQQERPEQLVTFSSHAVSFKSLYEVNYWQRNMVSDDSRIFWNMFFAYNGDYKVVPISYPVSMDANLAGSFLQTTKNIYKQHRRWMWGVENVPYILFNSLKDKKISFGKKMRQILIQIEGFWSLATNPVLILLLGWLPLVLGGKDFNTTMLSYNLPFVTRNLMIIAMLGLLVSATIAWRLLPPMPKDMKKGFFRKIAMILQWFLVPATILIFGALPGLEAQTRLMLGRYLGFWVTPKHRK